jgi:hypothetical protein
MGAKIVKDLHYTHDNRGVEVFTLIIAKNDISSFGRSYTIPELQDIAETIIKFLEKRNEI